MGYRCFSCRYDAGVIKYLFLTQFMEEVELGPSDPPSPNQVKYAHYMGNHLGACIMITDLYLLSVQYTLQLYCEPHRVKAISQGISLLGSHRPSLLHMSNSRPDDRYTGSDAEKPYEMDGIRYGASIHFQLAYNDVTSEEKPWQIHQY